MKVHNRTKVYGAPKGHVARSICEGKRPFLTCTVAGETFAALDRLANDLGLSRGRYIDLLITRALQADLDAAIAIYEGKLPSQTETGEVAA